MLAALCVAADQTALARQLYGANVLLSQELPFLASWTRISRNKSATRVRRQHGDSLAALLLDSRQLMHRRGSSLLDNLKPWKQKQLCVEFVRPELCPSRFCPKLSRSCGFLTEQAACVLNGTRLLSPTRSVVFNGSRSRPFVRRLATGDAKAPLGFAA